MKKIYMASSYKNKELLVNLTTTIRTLLNFQVYLFCESFDSPVEIPSTWNAVDAMKDVGIIGRYTRNRKEIQSSDLVLAVFPAGKSTHMEIGFAAGLGIPVISYGKYPCGEYDAMYGFIDKMFYGPDQYGLLLEFLKNFSEDKYNAT